MSIEGHYQTVKTAMRQLARRESLYVIWAYSQYLQVNGFRIPPDIQVANVLLQAHPPQTILAEWTLEQMAREVIRYADEVARRGSSLTQWNTLAVIANAFRDLEGEIYEKVGGERIHLELMRIAHRQFVWQQNRLTWTPIIRYYKLFNTPAIVAHATNTTGLTVNQIYLIGMSYLGHFFRNSRIARQPNIQIPGLTQEHFDRFLAFTSLRWNVLASRLRAEHKLDESFAYRYSSLREFPLIQISHQGHDEIVCPIPTLLFWRITSGFYYSLKDTPGFPTAFGASFQKYVGEVLQQRITNPRMEVLKEEQYHRGHHRKDSVDWIVQQNDQAALFVECKTKRLTWASKAGLSDLSALEQDVRKLAGAIVQVYKTIADYRDGLYPHIGYLAARRIYPAIVTLEDWYFFGWDMPARLDAAVRAIMETAGLPAAWLDEMPYSILSVDEFEMGSGVINAAGIQPVVQRKVQNPEFRRWGFAAYLNDQFRFELRNLPDLFRDEYQAMFANLA